MRYSYLIAAIIGLVMLQTSVIADNNNQDPVSTNTALPSARVAIVTDGSVMTVIRNFFRDSSYKDFQQYQGEAFFNLPGGSENATRSSKP